jgi:endonuclease/exonuclease/phosphatase family metal-dependent hydrolase
VEADASALWSRLELCNFVALVMKFGQRSLVEEKNKRFNSNPTFERLDRFLANAEWCATFPNTAVYHLPMMRSDHAPILAILTSNKAKRKRPFHFENYWLLEPDFKQVAQKSWHLS